MFPAGANLSVLLPLAPDEVFVRTFERGAGLTASCGSGMAASRAVWSRVSAAAPEREVLIRNAGGTATVSLNVQDDRWHPVVQGNATLVYRAEVDPAALRPRRRRASSTTRSVPTPPWRSGTRPACARPAWRPRRSGRRRDRGVEPTPETAA